MDELTYNERVVMQVFRRYNVDAQVVPAECFQSSGMNIISVLPGASTKVAAVTRLADELDDILTRRLGYNVSVRFETRPLRILVPRQQPVTRDVLDVVESLKRRLRNERGLLAVVGEAIGVRRPELLTADLTGSNTPHWLLAGATGSGKTTALIGMVASMALLNKPERLTMWILDPKNELSFLRGLPCVGRVVTGADACVKALSDAVNEMDNRSRYSHIKPSHRVVVVIDELADLIDVAGVEAEKKLKRILQMGRGLGIHVVAATQHALADNIGSTAKANFSVRLAFRTPSAEAAKVATGIAASGAERLPGRGAAIKVGASGVEFVQAFNVDPERVAALGPVQTTAHVAHHNEDDKDEAPVSLPDVQREQAARRQSDDYWMARAVPAFAQYYDPSTGELKRGGIAAIIRRMYGKTANTGGANHLAALAVVDKLIAAHATTTQPQRASTSGRHD